MAFHNGHAEEVVVETDRFGYLYLGSEVSYDRQNHGNDYDPVYHLAEFKVEFRNGIRAYKRRERMRESAEYGIADGVVKHLHYIDVAYFGNGYGHILENVRIVVENKFRRKTERMAHEIHFRFERSH